MPNNPTPDLATLADEVLEMVSHIQDPTESSYWTMVDVTAVASRLARAAKAGADELTELNQLFDLQHTRMVEATKVWQSAHPEEPGVYPDLGDMLKWFCALLTADKVNRRIIEGELVAANERADAAEKDNAEWERMYDAIPRHEKGIPGAHFISVHNRMMEVGRERLAAAEADVRRARDWIRGCYWLFDQGAIQRSIDRDDESDYAVRSMKFGRWIASAQDLLPENDAATAAHGEENGDGN